MEVDKEVTYSGSISAGDADIGTGMQTSDQIMYDTRSTECIIPDTAVTPAGWFDSTGYDYSKDFSYEVYLGEWNGLCYVLTTRVCIEDGISDD